VTRHTAVVLGGALTSIGRYGGSLSHCRGDDLLGHAFNAAVERIGVERGDVGSPREPSPKLWLDGRETHQGP
jgi:acetyl-CoA acetyltransferase